MEAKNLEIQYEQHANGKFGYDTIFVGDDK
jgi:hypothetical protein